MAREIQEIKKQITDAFTGDETIKKLYGLQNGLSFEEQFSAASLENILFYTVAYCIFILEKLFDTHKNEVDGIISELKPHSLKWYRNKALDFQYGFNLLPDSDKFNNENYSDEQVEVSKIVKYAAVTESNKESRLVVKIATETNSELNPISDEQKEAFAAYILEVRDAGVPVTVINYRPDLLELYIKIKRNPLVLDSQGFAIAPVNGDLKPVETAIKGFLKRLPFNGELILSALTDVLQGVDGVKDIYIVSAKSAWVATSDSDSGYDVPQLIDMSIIPKSGYFKIKTLDITYVV